MQFAEGQLVVHPHHGPCVVTGVVTRTIKGVDRQYVDLRVQRTDLVLSVPAEGVQDVGLRPVFGAAELARLAEVLRAPSEPFEKQWSRRMKANQEKVLTGELMVIAGAVRDLVRRAEDGGISAAEKDLLRAARRPILGEIVESLSVTDEQAEELLDGLILGRDVEFPARLSPAS
jgi:CarD family transcriptional regulator